MPNMRARCGRAGTSFIPMRSLRKAQGLPYALLPRVLSKQEWLERYGTPGAEAEFYARLRYGEHPAGADSGVKTIQEPAATALLPNCP